MHFIRRECLRALFATFAVVIILEMAINRRVNGEMRIRLIDSRHKINAAHTMLTHRDFEFSLNRFVKTGSALTVSIGTVANMLNHAFNFFCSQRLPTPKSGESL